MNVLSIKQRRILTLKRCVCLAFIWYGRAMLFIVWLRLRQVLVLMQQLQQKKLQAAIVDICAAPLQVVVKQSIDSTNNWSSQQCKSGRNLPFACFAEQQTQGRGRRGKQWLMAAGSNIAMSIAWPVDISYQQLNLLPLSVALAIVETLEGLGLSQVQIKWPNDVFVNDKIVSKRTKVSITDKIRIRNTIISYNTDSQVFEKKDFAKIFLLAG